MARRARIIVAIVGCLSLLSAALPVRAVQAVWSDWLTSFQGDGEAIAVDQGGVYAAASQLAQDGNGWTAVIRKYDLPGNVVWTREFGTAAADRATGIAVDPTGVYVSGTTGGDLEGRSIGFRDAFLRKYDLSGNVVWTRQFGTPFDDTATAVAASSGSVFVAGAGDAAYVRRYDSAGNLMWERTFGTTREDEVESVAADASAVYVAGSHWASDPACDCGWDDGFLRKYDAEGALAWSRAFGTAADDEVSGVALTPGAVYVTGHTEGALDGPRVGSWDAFLRKYDPAGQLIWGRQFGTPSLDAGLAVAATPRGAYVSGTTAGRLGSGVVSSEDDFVRKYDPAGNAIWTRQTVGRDYGAATGVTVAGGDVYLTGSIVDASQGLTKAFVRKYSIAPNGRVSVNRGASYTNAATVSVVTASGDDATAEVRISNDPSTADGILVRGRTYPYGTAVSWDLADPGTGGSGANGTRSVYVQWGDGTGDWSAVKSDSIVLDTVAPAIGAPVHKLATTQLQQSLVAVHVSWAASDATSGIKGYELQENMSGSWQSVSLPSATSRSVVRWLSPGATVSYRVRAQDRATNWSDWAAGASFVVAAHDESAPAIEYRGEWSAEPLADAFGGAVKHAATAGASATLRFAGRDVAFVTTRGPDRGKAEIWLDGSAVATVDLYAASPEYAAVALTRSVPPGEHTVEVRVTGRRSASSSGHRVDMDAVVTLR